MDRTLARANPIIINARLKMMAVSLRQFLSAISSTFFLYDGRVGLGLLLILAVFQPTTALLASICAIVCHHSSKLFYAGSKIQSSGLFYLNGWFLGLSVSLFFGFQAEVVILACIGSVVTAGLVMCSHRVLQVWGLPILIFPFVVGIWGLIEYVRISNYVKFQAIEPFQMNIEFLNISGLMALFRGVGQIFLIDNPIVGVLIVAVLGIARPKAVGLAILASFLAIWMSKFVMVPLWQIESGLPVFPAFLLVMASASGHIGQPLKVAMIYGLLAGPVEALAITVCQNLNLPALSMSYIVLVWFCVLVAGIKAPSSRKLAVY